MHVDNVLQFTINDVIFEVTYIEIIYIKRFLYRKIIFIIKTLMLNLVRPDLTCITLTTSIKMNIV